MFLWPWFYYSFTVELFVSGNILKIRILICDIPNFLYLGSK
uniref:Uncharacterized protein n=1 Tax=Siphoviridae sp. ctfbh2 TaxID=2827909 RepID=A0A8S5T412_9CAUD|nr:MAG TPA: hypothetical protein [Siphoviridae sp. ctfbh2]